MQGTLSSFMLMWFAVSIPYVSAQTQLPPPATIKVDYTRDIKPLLSQQCYACHGPEVQQSGLRLDQRQNALRGGDYGPVIILGKSAESKLIRRLVDGDGGMQMPPTGPLSDEEIGLLRAWIDQGVDFLTEISEEAPPKPVGPKVAALISAVRSGDQRAVEKLITANPEIVSGRDAGGSTALHHAAGFGSLGTLNLLIEKDAEVNVKNRRSSTPLHWAIHDEAKVRLLLSHGAVINAKEVGGRTPLYLASLLGNGNSTLRLLLDKGADPKLATTNGQTPLMATTLRGDTVAILLLIGKGVDVDVKNGGGATALMNAAASGNTRALELLIEKGADVNVASKRNETALGNAATTGVLESVQLLLDQGAKVNVRNFRGYSPLMFAASSDTMPADIVKLLLAKGADTSYTGDYDEPALALAAKRGNTEVARLLGADLKESNRSNMSDVLTVSTEDRSIPKAVGKSLALLEKQSHNFIRIAGCNSCHSQDLPSAAAAFARDRGLPAPKQIPQLPASMLPSPERVMDFKAISPSSTAWELFDLGMNHAPRDQNTDARVHYILATQTAEGNWLSRESRRPPMNVGEFQGAALAIYSIKNYFPEAEKERSEKAIARATAWLETAEPKTNQDYAFRLMGLSWGRGDAAVIKSASLALAAMQRADGGWSQLPAMISDAYATGQALYALRSAGNMAGSDPVFQKGVDYLLRTQAVDGSWHVKSRSIWLQPYFESGFPYGQDQFISTAGTAWASMALTLAVQPEMLGRR